MTRILVQMTGLSRHFTAACKGSAPDSLGNVISLRKTASGRLSLEGFSIEWACYSYHQSNMECEEQRQHSKFTRGKRIFLLLFGLILVEVDVISDLLTGFGYICKRPDYYVKGKNGRDVVIEGGALIVFLALSANFWYLLMQT